MTKKNIFSFYEYKAYLVHVEEYDPQYRKGFRSRLAEATGCQNAFVSQVLNGDVNFNLEQALRIGSFLRLREDEHQFFLWMVEWKRAGTVELKKYFQNLMNQLREKNLEIKERVQITQVLSSEAQTVYYSSWIYSAIHIAVMIPKLNNISKLAKALELSEERIAAAVQFLTENGLVEYAGKELKSGRTQIHLSRQSGNINKHHTNWRIEAVKSLDRLHGSDLHYSGVSSLSKQDVDKIRHMFVELIENYVRLVEKSPEETLYAFNLDFFSAVKASET